MMLYNTSALGLAAYDVNDDQDDDEEDEDDADEDAHGGGHGVAVRIPQWQRGALTLQSKMRNVH